MKITERYPLLGHKVRDKASGFTGFACSAHETLTGMLQYGICPTCKEDTPHELPGAKLFDYHFLEHVVPVKADGTATQLDAFIQPCDLGDDSWIEIGAEVRDRIIIGNSGIVAERATFLSGCVYYTVVLQKAAFKVDQIEPTLFHSYRRFEVIGEGLNKRVKEQTAKDDAAATETKPARPGGPVRDMPSRGRF